MFQFGAPMTKPLALVFYERLLPGSQLVNRLEDLGYRVRTISDASMLIETARQEKPLVAMVDLVGARAKVCEMVKELREAAETAHIPVIGFMGQKESKLQAEATKCGVTLVALDEALLPQLPQLLDHVLQVE
jgi:PleD family two-component response regulator